MGQFKLTISRYWNHPKIMTQISGNGISLTIDLNDFRESFKKEISLDEFKAALKEQIGSVRWIFRNKTFEATTDQAFEDSRKVFDKLIDQTFKDLIERIKEESAKIV